MLLNHTSSHTSSHIMIKNQEIGVYQFRAAGIADNVFGYPKFARSANLSAARRDPAHSNIPICAGFARTEQMRRSRMVP